MTSIRRPVLAVVALATIAATVVAPSLVASASPGSTSLAEVRRAGAVPASVVDAAEGVMPAERLGTVPPVDFPMEVVPRCDILDNFGDPRSGGRTHQGADLLATLGQEVYAMVDGTLTGQTVVGDGSAGSTLSGNLWRLTAGDGSGTYYVYAHLSAFAPGLTKGSKVVEGQVLGYVGDTGNPGPGNYHLHFEIHPGGGAAVDPLPLLTIPSACRVY